MNAREQRGLAIAALCRLKHKGNVWQVPSQTVAKCYVVDLEKQSCDCPDCQEWGHKCKHLYAVEFTLKREMGADGAVTETRQITFTEKVKYPQNWPAYNKAQTQEKKLLQVLLHDLCRDIPEPPYKGIGRLPTPAKDAVFACGYKVYSMLSGRRFMTDMREAAAKGFVVKPVPYNSIYRFFENEIYTPIFSNLIARSSLPLKPLESQFAVDSSGFTTSRFVSWYDHRYGVTRRGHDWVKVHLMCGVKTNIVTSVEIHGRNAGDAPQFGPLVQRTALNFEVKEISADKGYSSEQNIKTAFQIGAVPFIQFKDNTTDAKGGLWEKMFHFYQLHQDEFFEHYHKRSNVETTFSMIKAKFGDHIRSKTDTAMRNEALCKILCHNICCVIQSMYEFGIQPTFAVEQEAAS